LSAKGAALFLDRDGTLIVDTGYPREPSRVECIEGAAETLRACIVLGYVLVVVSNQSGVGRGIITPEEARAVDVRFQEVFAAEGVTFAAVHYCFHAPSAACLCRKPKPGMILQAIEALNLEPRLSYLVGDKPSDIEAGASANVPAMLLGALSWEQIRTQIVSGGEVV
jgi:D-glycero-D-manno-heptose 1,7-bisphosphate phosphatase